jgi:signal transduction histidine kinase
MTRLRVEALDRLVSPADEKHLAEVEAALEASVRELEPLLQPEERLRWQRFLPFLSRFRQHLTEAMQRLRQGQHERARALLTTEVDQLADHLQKELDAFSQENQAESVVLLEAADRRLARMRHFQIAVDLALAVGLLAIWWNVLRIIVRQRRQLDAHVRQVEQSNRDLDAFAGRIAHDLRNALTPLVFLAARLRRQTPDTGLGEPVARELEAAVRSARNLLDGLLAFSRAGQAHDPNARASLAAVVHEVERELTPLVARLQVELAVDVQDVDVACPPGLLQLVVANLAGNAVKFLDGRPVRHVRIEGAAAADGWCTLTVTDTGPGIPATAVERIFEPFYRVPGVQAAGTGIGLATVRRIVEAYGGQVTVESQAERGAIFRVRLRRAAAVERLATTGVRSADGSSRRIAGDSPPAPPR